MPIPRTHEARSYLWLPALIVGLPFDYRSIFDSVQFDHRNEATSKAAQLIRFPPIYICMDIYIYFPTFPPGSVFLLLFSAFSWASARFPLFCLWLLKIAESKCKQKRKNTKKREWTKQRKISHFAAAAAACVMWTNFPDAFPTNQPTDAPPFHPVHPHTLYVYVHGIYTLHTF